MQAHGHTVNAFFLFLLFLLFLLLLLFLAIFAIFAIFRLVGDRWCKLKATPSTHSAPKHRARSMCLEISSRIFPAKSTPSQACDYGLPRSPLHGLVPTQSRRLKRLPRLPLRCRLSFSLRPPLLVTPLVLLQPLCTLCGTRVPMPTGRTAPSGGRGW